MQLIAPDLSNVISAALQEARVSGLDKVAAIGRAARLVRRVRPDLSPDEAWMLVEGTVAQEQTKAA